jgi:hypothetical protein
MKKRLNRKNAIYTANSGTTRMINYEDVHHILEVEFVDGDIYHYLKVPADLWNDYKSVVSSGKSSGGFLNLRIKPFFPYRKISND